MSEDPEKMNNEEVGSTVNSNQTDSPADSPLSEASTSKDPSPDVSILEGTDKGEALISDFRESLIEQDEAESSATAHKEKKPGIIRRITGMLIRKTGKLDESHLHPSGEAIVVQDEAIHSVGLSDEGKPAPLKDSDLNGLWTALETQGSALTGETSTAKGEVLPIASLFDMGKTVFLKESDLDGRGTAKDTQSPALSGEASDSKDEPLPAVRFFDNGKTVLLKDNDLDERREVKDSNSPAPTGGTSAAKDENIPTPPIYDKRKPVLLKESILDNFWAALDAKDPDQSGEVPVQNPGFMIPEPSAQALFAEKAQQDEVHNHKDLLKGGQPVIAVTNADIKDAGDVSQEQADQHVVPEDTLLVGLEPDTIPLSISFGRPESVPQTKPADAENAQPKSGLSLWRRITDFLVPSEKTKKELGTEAEVMPDTQIIDRLKTGTEENLSAGPSIFGADKNATLSLDQVQLSEPSPFVDENMSQSTPFAVSSESSAASPAFEQSESDSDTQESGLNASQSADGISQLFTADSPWLGELRNAIDTDDGFQSPFSEPEDDGSSEKSDILDRLLAEEKRIEQAGKNDQVAESIIKENDAVLREIPDWMTALEEPSIGHESDFKDPPVFREDSTDREEPATGEGKPFWSQGERDELIDGHGIRYEGAAEDKSDAPGLPKPSKEAIQEMKESIKLYESMVEDQNQQQMRSVLLGEDANQEGTISSDGRNQDFTEEFEERAKPWWARLTRPQIGMIVLAVVFLVALVTLTVVYVFPRNSALVAATQTTAVQSSGPNGPYPIGIQLTGGWIFSLNRSTLVQGRWTPQRGEWLAGTQVRRVVALPWTRQTDAVIRSLLPGDEIRLFFSNKQAIQYKVSEVKQVMVDDVSLLSGIRSSLVVILYQSGTTLRWVAIADQEP